jgi:H+/Cl- antiporter ClcA
MRGGACTATDGEGTPVRELLLLLLLLLSGRVSTTTHAGGLLLPWLAFTGSSCACCLLAGLGVAYLSPLAAGSGIPHIMAYCNGIEIPGLLVGLRFRVQAEGVEG